MLKGNKTIVYKIRAHSVSAHVTLQINIHMYIINVMKVLLCFDFILIGYEIHTTYFLIMTNKQMKFFYFFCLE